MAICSRSFWLIVPLSFFTNVDCGFEICNLQINHTLPKGSIIWKEKMKVSLKGQNQGQQKAKNRVTQCVTVPRLHTPVRHHSVWFTAKRKQTITLCQRQSQPLVEEIQLCFSSELWERSCTVKVSGVCCIIKLISHFRVAFCLCFNLSLHATCTVSHEIWKCVLLR